MDDDSDVDLSSAIPANEASNCDSAANFYDFMDDPDLDSDCPVIDEIGAFITFYLQSLVTIKNKKLLLDANNKQIFAMLSCFAFDSVSTTKPTTNSQELYLLTNTAFSNVYENLFIRSEFANLVLNKFPNKTWPPSFVSYLEELQDAIPTESWLNKNAKMYKTHDVSIHRKLHFGFSVITIAKKAFSQIKMHYNRRYKYPHELKSGVNMSAMFKAIKICLFKPNVQRLAISAADKVDARAKNSNKDLMTPSERRAYIVEKVANDCKNYDPSTYWPEFWLAFLVCSIPVMMRKKIMKMLK
eukprot:CAMPEP_0170079758 /NCGR_PEP_ID=MMETSP0019_2-20121128/16053_1 /TAXON_ID=98059 /ORGANISM="Dinobryon sp., Strain UTEXLB2267" /LENGTH=298 /DNA_ID=CAMNT_0010293363 /DNA_START=1280 /DNA_END=2176 /DNA_ORIENTATION=+